LVAAFAAAVALTASAPAGGAAPGAVAWAAQQAPGARLWVARYNGGANSEGFAYSMAVSMAVSPDGSRVFVTGKSEGRTTGYDYAPVAYSTATGGQLWVRRYSGAGNRADIARSVAVSPGGSRVFVTGESRGRGTFEDYATVAYDAATGRRLWVGQPLQRPVKQVRRRLRGGGEP